MGAFLDKLGWAELGLGHFDAAIEASSKAIQAGSTVYFTDVCLATRTRSKATSTTRNRR
jgi:hypothetical protein